MREFVDIHTRLGKPDGAERDRRTRESGLLGAIKVYEEDPPLEALSAATTWVSYSGWPRLKTYDGHDVIVLASSGGSENRGDASITLTLDDAPTQYFRTPFSANRVVTLPPEGESGDHFSVITDDLGAFTLEIEDSEGNTLKIIPASTRARVDVGHDGSAWHQTGYQLL